MRVFCCSARAQCIGVLKNRHSALQDLYRRNGKDLKQDENYRRAHDNIQNFLQSLELWVSYVMLRLGCFERKPFCRILCGKVLSFFELVVYGTLLLFLTYSIPNPFSLVLLFNSYRRPHEDPQKSTPQDAVTFEQYKQMLLSAEQGGPAGIQAR